MSKRRRDLSTPSNDVPLLNDKFNQLASTVQRLTDDGLLDADAINGVLAESVGGTGERTFANGELLIGNGNTKGLNRAVLTPGANVTITNGPGTVQISSSGSGDVASDASTSVDGEVALFKSTTGKLIKRATGTGFAKLTSGVLSAVPSIVESNLFLSNNTTADSTSIQHGLLPRLSGSSSDVFKGDGSWGTVTAGGNVTGPATATTNNDLALFDGTTGQLLKDAGKGVPTGALVGDTDSQTLTNKTLTTPTIGNLTNATHTHQNAAGGGTLDAAAIASGTLGAGRMPALTGDITTSAGAVATTLATVSVTSGTTGDASHVAQITTNVKGLVTAQSSVAIVITPTAAGLSNVTNDVQTKAAVVPNTAPSSGQILVGNAGGTAYAPQSMSGDATIASTGAVTIAVGAVTLTKQADMATASVVYRKTAGAGAPEVNTLVTLKTDLGLTGTNSGDQTIALTGDVTGTGTGSFAATIGANKATLAKLDASTPTANKVLMSGASASPTWSTPTFPNASATSGKTIRSDGTNWIASAATLSDSPGTAGKVLLSDGTNWIPSTPTFPNASATAGKFIRSDGTNWLASSSTIPDTFTKGDMLAATTNALTAVAVGTDGFVMTADAASTPGVKWAAAGKTTQLSGGTNTVNVTANTTSFWAAAANGTGATTTQQTTDVSGGTRSTICKAGTLKNLFVTCGAAAGSGKTTTFTVLKNGTSTGITCTVSGASQVTNSDTTHSASVVAGDEITVQITTQTGYTASKMAWGLECEITAGGTGHALLSSTHTDTTAAAVVRGDVITGQTATPLWQRLALGSAGKILRSDGTDLSYTTATYPATTTANQLLYSSATNAIAEITAAASSVLTTDASNVPSLTTTTWTTRAFSAGNFTGSSSMTWTLIAGNVTTDAYLLIGKTMWYAAYIVGGSVGGTPDRFLQITLPAGKTANKTMAVAVRIVDNGVASIGWGTVSAAGTLIQIARVDTSNWSASVNNTQLMFEIMLETT